MSKTWLNFGTKKLNVGGGGGGGEGGGGVWASKNMEYVLVGALALIIVAAIVMTVWQLFFSGPGGGEDYDTVQRYKCEKCGYTWEFDMSEMNPEENPEMMMGPMGPGMGAMDCPKCKEKRCAFLMVKCPKEDCGEYYIGESTKWHARMYSPDGTGEMSPDGEPPHDVCPKCGTDRTKFYRDRARARRKKK